ncbi:MULTISPECIES: MerR family DNA-binding protein [Halomonadaceae]|uniref:helix-turn-helix domain-containing protein n=1 Tax=Halomonadaceae TaxID=28256 RepID=UPI001F215584|nr:MULTISPECIES: MerR family DNA-binding protein [Halomonas]MDW0359851.1 MerR family DNA-binding protein [Halomonas venusta]UQI39241.1 MerR family DNA-binding protein [Halomonas venusta]
MGRLRFIDCLRSLGVSLPEIKQILSWADQGTVEFNEPVPLATQRRRLHLRTQELQVIARWLDNMNQDKMTESFSVLPSTGVLVRKPMRLCVAVT